MTEQEKQEAQKHLDRARRQGRHATRNTARAAQVGAEAVAEDIADGAEHVVNEAKTRAPRISAHGMSMLTGDLGVGFLATSVSIYSGVIAIHAFKRALAARSAVTR